MVEIAFCDDDVLLLKDAKALLKRYRQEYNQGISYTIFQSPLELLSDIAKGKRFDILFLDVIMPGENGISTAKEIREYDYNVKIIFLTSSAEFAVESYTVGAYFYQMKPICEESFFKLLDSVIAECQKEQQHSLILHCKNGIGRIDLDKLEYCEVIGRTLFFHLVNGKVLESTGSLDKLSRQLTEYDNFLRPHRSFLINMEYIQSITSHMIVMSCAAEITIPHGKYSMIKNKYLEYSFQRKKILI